MATQIEIQVCKTDYHYGIIEIYKFRIYGGDNDG